MTAMWEWYTGDLLLYRWVKQSGVHIFSMNTWLIYRVG